MPMRGFWEAVMAATSRRPPQEPYPRPFEDEETVRPIQTELCSEEEARQKFEEFFERYQRGGGADLRVELVRGLSGIRFTLVSDWGDMS